MVDKILLDFLLNGGNMTKELTLKVKAQNIVNNALKLVSIAENDLREINTKLQNSDVSSEDYCKLMKQREERLQLVKDFYMELTIKKEVLKNLGLID